MKLQGSGSEPDEALGGEGKEGGVQSALIYLNALYDV